MEEIKKNKKINFAPYLFLSPYLLLFIIFIVVPILMAIFLSFTYFNSINAPLFIGLKNYMTLITMDQEFMQQILPNTIKFAVIVGPGGYLLGFFLAWSLAQVTKRTRTIMAVILYSPSLTAGVAMTVIWKTIFSGDQNGIMNSVLMNLGLIDAPIAWLLSPDYLMTIMIVVALWSSMGVGFLAMLSGVLNINQDLYEAAYVDGMKNRWQEVFYITIPSMKPQMLFGAVMAIVNTFNIGSIGVLLSGSNPTPQNSGQLIVNFIEDYGFIRFDMGYACCISVILLLIVYVFSKISFKLFGDKNE